MSDNPYGVALFVLQKISCVLSATGSSMIISQISRNQFNRSKPQQRLLLGLSISDFCTSFIWILTPLLMPSGTWGSPWAVGNQTTCNLQGFIVTLFNASAILYMCALQTQYLLTIKYGWTEGRIRRKAEPYMHAFPWGLGLAAAISQLSLKLYNPADWDCWIAPYPSDCTSSYQVKKGGTDLTETDCIRGDNAEIYQWAFFFAPLWVAIAFCILAMALIFRSVREKERRTRKYTTRSSISSSAKERRKRSTNMTEKVKTQCFMYAGAFFVVWTFPTIARLIQLLGGVLHPIIGVLAGTFIGIQGFLNAIIYFRPRYHMMASETRETARGKLDSDYMPLPPARPSGMSEASSTSRVPDMSVSDNRFKQNQSDDFVEDGNLQPEHPQDDTKTDSVTTPPRVSFQDE